MKKSLVYLLILFHFASINLVAQRTLDDSLRIVRERLFSSEMDSVEKNKLTGEYWKLIRYKDDYNGWPPVEDTTHFTIAFRQKISQDSAFRMYRDYVVNYKYSDSFRLRALYAINNLGTLTADTFLFATIVNLCCIAGEHRPYGIDIPYDPSFEVLKSRGKDDKLLKAMLSYLESNTPSSKNRYNYSLYANDYQPYCRVAEGILGKERTIPWIKQQIEKQKSNPLLLKNLDAMLSCEEWLQKTDRSLEQTLKH